MSVLFLSKARFKDIHAAPTGLCFCRLNPTRIDHRRIQTLITKRSLISLILVNRDKTKGSSQRYSYHLHFGTLANQFPSLSLVGGERRQARSSTRTLSTIPREDQLAEAVVYKYFKLVLLHNNLAYASNRSFPRFQ